MNMPIPSKEEFENIVNEFVRQRDYYQREGYLVEGWVKREIIRHLCLSRLGISSSLQVTVMERSIDFVLEKRKAPAGEPQEPSMLSLG